MRVFVTGASGWIGSAVTRDLLNAGHDVVGLARSDASAEAVTALGADAVVHLAYLHDFSRMTEAAELDRRAVETLAAPLEGTGAPLLIASGVLGLARGRAATERDSADPAAHPRVATAAATLELAERGIRPIVARFAPTVHGTGDHGFVATLVDTARRHGASGYIGDGSHRWPAVHRDDAARLVRLAIEQAPESGAVLHAVAEEGIPTRDIAAAIGAAFDLPVVSVPAEQAQQHFGWIGAFFAADVAATNDLTRDRFGWVPSGPGLLEDIATGAYSGVVPHATA